MTIRRSVAAFTAACAPLLFAGPAAAAQEPMTKAQAEAVLEGKLGDSPELVVGDKAPKLYAAEWIQGDPVSEFEPDRTYIVEMWATWCQPCIPAVSHLHELKNKYEAQDAELTIIGMNIWDSPNGDTPERRKQRIRAFMDARNGDMSYTVAYEADAKMAETWMQPAGQNGIPAAFIVDGQGRIAWVGHPMTIDQPLERIIAGEWDIEAARAQQLRGVAAMQQLLTDQIAALLEPDTRKQAYQTLEALTLTVFEADPDMRANLAYLPLAAELEGDAWDSVWSMRIAKDAVEASDGGAIPLAVLAAIYHETGDAEKAVETVRRAIEASDVEALTQQLRADLARYERDSAG